MLHFDEQHVRGGIVR